VDDGGRHHRSYNGTNGKEKEEPEGELNAFKHSSPHLTENTTLHRYRDPIINAV
jgi:hypothetical protein